MTARRPLLTAVAAGTLLCAMWFVPSANASAERPPPVGTTAQRAPAPAAEPPTAATAARAATAPQALAATGGVDTTPYLFGGVAFVAAGGALVTTAARKSPTAAG
ncbi:hypothetical protein AB0F13_01380 [Streptomyces sp. NPDC026206]|uniref:hypothetical protein n=1 Tax=Streptomyces sp. NPDC026206 TaxID=3157089 RepID=UPI0033D3463F